MIRAKNLSFSYPGVSVLENISFEIDEGDFVALIGPNGAGKTTLIKLILGLEKMQKGSLDVFGESVSKFVNKESTGYVPQKYSIDKLFPGTVREILHSHGGSPHNLIRDFSVDNLLDKKFTELSGGQQQKVLMALALQRHPRLLILDEPTVGVDIQSQRKFFESLKKLNNEHKVTIVLVTHDIGMVPQIAKTVLCINHNVCCSGHASQTTRLLKKVYGVHEEHHHHDHYHQ